MADINRIRFPLHWTVNKTKASTAQEQFEKKILMMKSENWRELTIMAIISSQSIECQSVFLNNNRSGSKCTNLFIHDFISA